MQISYSELAALVDDVGVDIAAGGIATVTLETGAGAGSHPQARPGRTRQLQLARSWR